MAFMNVANSEIQLKINPGQLSLDDLRVALNSNKLHISITSKAKNNIERSVNTVRKVIDDGKIIYGVNTGFGKLANISISKDKLSQLQHNLVTSHCTGVGNLIDDKLVRLIAVLKINSLAMGYSGVRFEVMELLLAFINEGYYPCIPSQGSVGASGDLSPLAHLVAPLIGEGYVRKDGNIICGKEALKAIGRTEIMLGPLEGLSLLNGTQVSTAFAIKAYFAAEQLFVASLASGAMATDALRGSSTPFRKEIHQLRGQCGQMAVAKTLFQLLEDSEIRISHKNCEKIQDPYSIRCQPQVMGACLDQLSHISKVLMKETNAVTNNPIVLPDSGEILSGGNFHAEPIAFAADLLALVLCEIGSLSERRLALMVDPSFSQLPAFLINGSGFNSGFMIAQVTAAALVSENKSLSHPCSVDSIPTSANQEDHVSMATHAARRLFQMADNVAYVIAIEMLAAAQGFDFLSPKVSSPTLNTIYQKIRERVKFYESDHYMADDIKLIYDFVQTDSFTQIRDLIELPIMQAYDQDNIYTIDRRNNDAIFQSISA